MAIHKQVKSSEQQGNLSWSVAGCITYLHESKIWFWTQTSTPPRRVHQTHCNSGYKVNVDRPVLYTPDLT